VISRDHSPDDPEESARIAKAGGSVKNGRINGSILFFSITLAEVIHSFSS